MKKHKCNLCKDTKVILKNNCYHPCENCLIIKEVKKLVKLRRFPFNREYMLSKRNIKVEVEQKPIINLNEPNYYEKRNKLDPIF